MYKNQEMTGYFCFDLWLRVFSLSGLMAVASYENLNFLVS